MAIREENIRLILGLKVRQLRLDRKLSLGEVSAATGISVSYLNEIEKGKKRPRADKVAALAELYHVSYDWLVSLKLEKKLAPVGELIQSNILNDLPLEMFGLEPANLLELLTNAPTKLSAFVSTLIEINRSYDMSVEHFYFSVLRSYQEIHENYFEEIERAVDRFRTAFGLHPSGLSEESLYTILTEKYQYHIVTESFDEQPSLKKLRSVLIPGKEPELLLNSRLDSRQRMFVLGRELAYQFLELKQRPFTSTWVEVESFEQVLNNFKASYFASALIIHEQSLINDLKRFFENEKFDESYLTHLVEKYHATPETLVHRMTNLMPVHFGINQLFFLRFHHQKTSDTFHLTKEMHLSGLHNPHGTVLHEHYCRRWISLTIFNEERQALIANEVVCKAQKSKYINSANEYLVITLAHHQNSISIGLKLNKLLKKKIRFTEDHEIPKKIVNETCERCSLTDCSERVAEPTVLEEQNRNMTMRKALRKLIKNKVKA